MSFSKKFKKKLCTNLIELEHQNRTSVESEGLNPQTKLNHKSSHVFFCFFANNNKIHNKFYVFNEVTQNVFIT